MHNSRQAIVGLFNRVCRVKYGVPGTNGGLLLPCRIHEPRSSWTYGVACTRYSVHDSSTTWHQDKAQMVSCMGLPTTYHVLRTYIICTCCVFRPMYYIITYGTEYLPYMGVPYGYSVHGCYNGQDAKGQRTCREMMPRKDS